MDQLLIPMVALSAEGGAKSALDAATTAVIQNGFDTMQATVVQVIGIAVVSAVAVLCLTAGVNFALKKIRSVISKAS